MTNTKTKDFAKIFAIIAGFFFLVGGLLKTVYAASPLFIYMFDRMFHESNIYFSIELNQITMLEIIALFTLSGLCYSCKRSSALIIPVVSFAFINLYELVVSFCYDVYATLQLLMGYGMSEVLDYSTNIFYVAFAFVSLIMLALLVLLISVNVSLKKGIVLPLIFASLTVGAAILAYLSWCVGDVVQFVINILSGAADMGFFYFIGLVFFAPLINNLVKFVLVCGIFFMAIWLIFRPKTVEVKSSLEKKLAKAEKKAAKNTKAENDIEIVAEMTANEMEVTEAAFEEAVAEEVAEAL